MNPVASKETYKGKLNIYCTRGNDIIVGYEGKRHRQRKIFWRANLGGVYGFKFDGTDWMLEYDFNLKLDSETGMLHSTLPAAEENKEYPVFVYGTLRSGMRNHYILRDMYKGKGHEAITTGVMYHNGSIPYLYEGDEIVKGELFYLKPKSYKRAMNRLDSLEGFNGEGDIRYNHYNRKLVDVQVEDTVTQAWCYFANESSGWSKKDRMTRIVDGDFVRWHKEYRGRGW
jgi:gamma-glutamylcyclotransferase (GGCT)/AIG2-like uncharacterized protein YtfP